MRLRPVAAGVAEDDLVPSAAKLALDGVGCAGIVGIPDVHCEHGHRVQALADHALCNGTGSVVAAFEHLFHLGAGVGADSIFVVEHAGDGGDRDSGFPCNIVNIHILFFSRSYTLFSIISVLLAADLSFSQFSGV